MEDIEKIKRHLAKKIPIELENDDGCKDIFYLKPLNMEQQSMMIGLSKKFKGKNQEELEDISKEDFNEMVDLIKDIVSNSFELKDEMLDEFVSSNFNALSEKMVDLLPKSSKVQNEEDIKKKLLEKNEAKK